MFCEPNYCGRGLHEQVIDLRCRKGRFFERAHLHHSSFTWFVFTICVSIYEIDILLYISQETFFSALLPPPHIACISKTNTTHLTMMIYIVCSALSIWREAIHIVEIVWHLLQGVVPSLEVAIRRREVTRGTAVNRFFNKSHHLLTGTSQVGFTRVLTWKIAGQGRSHYHSGQRTSNTPRTGRSVWDMITIRDVRQEVFSLKK